MKEKQLKYLIKEIKKDIRSISTSYWHDYVGRHEYKYSYEEDTEEEKIVFEDDKTAIYENTKRLYHKICLFFELNESPFYLQNFKTEFEEIINDKKLTLKSQILYYDDEPSMKILYDFGVYLSAFHEFDYEEEKKIKYDKLKLLLENTNQIISKTKANITNEASIYNEIAYFVKIIFPSSRRKNKARFIKKEGVYNPDILVPEISSAVEYKLIKDGDSLNKYLDALVADVGNYTGDPEYRFFYAVVYFKNKADLIPESFNQAIIEKKFPDNWEIIAI